MSVHLMPEEPQPMPTKCPKHNLVYEGTCYMCVQEKAQKPQAHAQAGGQQPQPGTKRKIA